MENIFALTNFQDLRNSIFGAVTDAVKKNMSWQVQKKLDHF